MTFLLFQQTAVQSTILFLFLIFYKILYTSSAVKKSAAVTATIQEDKLNVIMVDIDDRRW